MIVCDLLLMEDVKELDEKVYDSIKRAVTFAVENEHIDVDAEISIAISNDEQIRELNRDFRDKDTATDVLSFPANDFSHPISYELEHGLEPELAESGAIFLGDIVISCETAARQAEEYGNTFTEEMCFLAVHGTLHLMGYDHIEPEDEILMREKQREARAYRNGGF